MLPDGSWEVSLSLPDQETSYIFVLSLIERYDDEPVEVIIHAFRKPGKLRAPRFCTIDPLDTYFQVREKVEILIATVADSCQLFRRGNKEELFAMPGEQ